MCLLEFLARNGLEWHPPPEDLDGDETVAVMEQVASSEIDEFKLAAWLVECTGSDG